MNVAALASCRELTTEHVEHAARSAEGLRSLLARVAEIAQPEDGGPKILFVLARLARGDVLWLEGDLTVELAGDEQATTLDLFSEQGWGIKERLAPRAHFAVPLDEFTRAVEISAKRFEPLRTTVKPNKIVLSSAPPAASAPPPAVEVELADASVGAEPSAELVAIEPEPFSVRPAIEPDPFLTPLAPDVAPDVAEITSPLTSELDDPADSFGAFLDDPGVPPKPPPPTAPPPKKHDSVHNRPTVRRMVAIKPEALRTGRKDPRREEDD